MSEQSKVHQGFTLTELAVVLFIIALLIGGLLVPLGTQRDLDQRQQTKTVLRDIHDALTGFALANGRLPCPADATIAVGANNAGLEAVSAAGGPCACNTAATDIATVGGVACSDTAPGSVVGVVPWATLGLPETDVTGGRFTYRVTTRFSRVATGQTDFGCTPAANPTTAAFALCSLGNLSVLPATGSAAPLAAQTPAVVISHGANGTNTTNADELDNLDGNASFVSNVNIDDQVIWISTFSLLNRMLTAGRLP